MIQRLPAVNENVGRLRATRSGVQDMASRLTSLCEGFAAGESPLSCEDLLSWCQVTHECLAMTEDLAAIQRIAFRFDSGGAGWL